MPRVATVLKLHGSRHRAQRAARTSSQARASGLLRRISVALSCLWVAIVAPSFPSSEDQPQEPQVIKLERFRKALWKVRITLEGKPGDFVITLDLAQGRMWLAAAGASIEKSPAKPGRS